MKTAIFLISAALACSAQNSSLSSQVDSVFPDAHTLYLDLHQHPELSSHETRTAGIMAERLRALGYEVTEHIGGNGIVAIMKNGNGPTVMLRTELDGLPVEEKTGLAFASKVRTKDDAGRDVPAMHACGHDVHMSALVATATMMARTKDKWRGTLMLVGQPAEETISGAKRMIDEGLFTRFAKPDEAVALHVVNDYPAGKVAVMPGYLAASADSIRITIYGRGGHGAMPNTTVDPIVIAARTVLALQTIVSREVKPGEAAVVTVGYLQAGTKNNIISDHAELGLTVRAFKPEVRKQAIASIRRIAQAEAAAAGAPRDPAVEIYETTDAVYNDPVLARRLRATL